MPCRFYIGTNVSDKDMLPFSGLQGTSTLKMVTVYFSETAVSIYESASVKTNNNTAIFTSVRTSNFSVRIAVLLSKILTSAYIKSRIHPGLKQWNQGC
jgi:hypothetical protein